MSSLLCRAWKELANLRQICNISTEVNMNSLLLAFSPWPHPIPPIWIRAEYISLKRIQHFCISSLRRSEMQNLKVGDLMYLCLMVCNTMRNPSNALVAIYINFILASFISITSYYDFYHFVLPLNKQLSWKLKGNINHLKQNTLLLHEQQSFILPQWNVLVSLENTAKKGWEKTCMSNPICFIVLLWIICHSLKRSRLGIALSSSAAFPYTWAGKQIPPCPDPNFKTV